MRIGSLVECIADNWADGIILDNAPLPKKGDTFVVADILKRKGCVFLSFQEIPTFYYIADHFRELQPPLDLSKIFEDEKVTELALVAD